MTARPLGIQPVRDFVAQTPMPDEETLARLRATHDRRLRREEAARFYRGDPDEETR